MKLHLLSDTHDTPITPHPEADLIVHAGDFGNGRSGAQAFQAACRRAGKPCLFVLGNHDYYGENIDELPRELITADAPLLTENRIIEFGGWTFVGGTLFSKGTPTKPLTTNKTAAASSSTRWATRTKSGKTATATACCWNCPISQRQPENGFSRFQAAFKRFCYSRSTQPYTRRRVADSTSSTAKLALSKSLIWQQTISPVVDEPTLYKAVWSDYISSAGVSPPTTSRGKPLHPAQHQPLPPSFP